MWMWVESGVAFMKAWPNSLILQLGFVVTFFLGYVLGIVLHEGIHAISWVLADKGVSGAAISFGIIRSSGIPYCHLKVPVRRNCYLIGILMPGLIVGLGPLVVGYVTGNFMAWLLGIFLIHAALSDIIVVRFLLKERAGSWIQDLPEALGYWIYPPGYEPPANGNTT